MSFSALAFLPLFLQHLFCCLVTLDHVSFQIMGTVLAFAVPSAHSVLVVPPPESSLLTVLVSECCHKLL